MLPVNGTKIQIWLVHLSYLTGYSSSYDTKHSPSLHIIKQQHNDIPNFDTSDNPSYIFDLTTARRSKSLKGDRFIIFKHSKPTSHHCIMVN